MTVYYTHWDNEHACDSVGPFNTPGDAIRCAYDILEGWMESSVDWESCGWYESEDDYWNSMIYNCFVSVYAYDPETDTRTDYWEPTDNELAAIGWIEREEV